MFNKTTNNITPSSFFIDRAQNPGMGGASSGVSGGNLQRQGLTQLEMMSMGPNSISANLQRGQTQAGWQPNRPSALQQSWGAQQSRYPSASQQMIAKGQAAGFGVPAGGAAGGGGIAGGINGLLQKQLAENEWAKNKNEANWLDVKNRHLALQGQYDRNTSANGARSLTDRLLADPEALNDKVQAQIMNRASNTQAAQDAAQQRQIAGQLAAGGQMDAASMAALTERQGARSQLTQQDLASKLEIQRANQRNQDIQNAAGLGQKQAMQDYGVSQGISRDLLTNLPQYQPQDLTGLIASLGLQDTVRDVAGSSGGMSFNPFSAVGGGYGLGAGTTYQRPSGSINRSYEGSPNAMPNFQMGATPAPIYSQTASGMGYGGQAGDMNDANRYNYNMQESRNPMGYARYGTNGGYNA